MGGLIKLIKNLFSGIFSFLGGLLAGKKSIEGSAPKTRKSSGYFLEFDDSGASKKPAVNLPIAEASSAPAAVIGDSTPSFNRSEQVAALASSSAPVEKALTSVAVAPKPEASVEFATKYLMPTSNGSRRRPGANMNSYLDMARGMKLN